MAIDLQERERKSAIKKRVGFEKWLDEPMVRLGLSMIPAGDKADALKMLLQSAFDAGYAVGCSDVVGDLLQGFLKRQPNEPPR
jgi:hypothetical protein